MNPIPDHILLSEGWEGEIYQKWSFPPEVIARWRSLAERQGDIGLFVSDGWFENWTDAFGKSEQPLVLVLKKRGETKAIFPCRIQSASEGPGKRSVIGSLTNDHTCHYDFVIDPEAREEALFYFIEILRRIASDESAFEYMPLAGENAVSFVRALRRDGSPVHVEEEPWAPWLSVSGDWDRFFDALPGRLRNTLKRCRKKGEEKGKLQFEVIRRSPRLDEALDVLFEIESRSWKGREGTAIKSDPRVESFYRRLAHWAMRENALFLFLLKLDGRPIAGSLCLSSGKTVFLLKPGYDEAFGALSPGTLLQAEILKYLFMLPEISAYNFLGACDGWKMEWMSASEEYGAIRVYPKSFKGRGRYFFRHGWKASVKRLRMVRWIMIIMNRNEGRANVE